MNVKEIALEVINESPDDITMYDLVQEIYVRVHIEQGLKDVEEGKTIPMEEIKKEYVKWK